MSRSRHSARHHRRRNKGLMLWLALFIVVFLAVYGVVLGKNVAIARGLLLRGKDELKTAAALASNMELAKSKAFFEKSENDFSKARKRLNRPSVRIAVAIPGINNNLNAVTSMSLVGAEVARSGESLAEALMKFPLKDGKPNFGLVGGRIDLAPFTAARPYLQKADTHASLALTKHNRMPHALLIPSIQSADKELGNELTELKRLTSNTNKAFGVLPDFLGAKGKRRYFLAIQNNAELRATGGLIGCYGVMTVEDGRLSLDAFDKITSIQRKSVPVDAPKGYVERYGRFKATSVWSNTNMSPDFPTVGQVLLNLYKSNAGEDLDGVISIDPVGMKYLLEALGPVWVPTASTNIDTSNIVRWALIEEYNRYQGQERRDFLVDAGEAIWRKLLSGQVGSPSKLLDQLSLAVREKRLILYVKNQDEQKVFEGMGCAGSITPTTCDYLQVIAQNQGANKVDVYLHESIDYSISLNTNGSARAIATVKITNNVPQKGLPKIVTGEDRLGAKNGHSNTYLSIYVPRDARLVDTAVDGKPGRPEVGYEKDKTVFSHNLYIAPGTTSIASFTYDLPNTLIFNGKKIDYIFDYQVQPVANYADLTINVKLPKDFDVKDLPDDASKQERRINANKTLTRDGRFTISLSDVSYSK